MVNPSTGSGDHTVRMESNSYWQLDKEYYFLTENHDLVIRIIEHTEVVREEANRTVKETKPNKVHEVKVKREILCKSAIYFQKLTDGGFNESQQFRVDLHEDSAEAAQGCIVWLKILHATEPGKLQETLTSTTLRGLWEILATAHKYGLDPKCKEAKAWFEGWYGANKDNPNYGFAATTKYLVYNATGHITEKRPTGFIYDHLGLDQLIIQQLNAARGRLKTILHRGLYHPIETLLKNATCGCKDKTLYAYEKALTDTGAWPLEQAYLKQSMSTIFKKLGAFPEDSKSQPCLGLYCKFHFGGVVDNALDTTKRYFHGLCLDCMDSSKPKFGDADEDYWKHAKGGNSWDDGCRINHNQPTWYFSFMGRREKMIRWTNRSRDRDESY